MPLVSSLQGCVLLYVIASARRARGNPYRIRHCEAAFSFLVIASLPEAGVAIFYFYNKEIASSLRSSQ
jgi:hypothetical protein